MKTGSLRARVILTTLALFAIVLTVVVTAVTLAYRAELDSQLRSRLADAGAAVERSDPRDLKPLIPALALQGFATRLSGPSPASRPAPTGTATTEPAERATSIQPHGSLLVLDEVLPGGTRVSLSASRAGVDHAVTSLLLVELVVAAAALALAALLILHGTRTALRPLSAIIETTTRIAHGDTKLRLQPSRTDTELGSLAAAFDRMLDSLETAIEEARASDAATRRFLADASHELRNPVAALQASAETLLREQPQRPERDRLEAAVARHSERLGRLISDLLSLARLQAHPARSPVDLAAIARLLVQDARGRAPDAVITLSAYDDTTMRGDPDALERVLRNLIDNALAAIQPSGRIDVQLRRLSGYIEARVADDGPGVPEDQREHIFERFVRLDPAKPGHGLGLAIARRIAQQHHGDLTCDLTPAGASFTLHLPTQPAPHRPKSSPGEVLPQ
jgi:two-component system OmpR family sensor kinase